MLAWLSSLHSMGISDDELLSCECLMLDAILLFCSWAIAPTRCAVMLRFIKFVLICSKDGVHFQSTCVFCDLANLIRNMLRKNELV